MLEEIVTNIELQSSIFNHTTTRKMHLYSSHDVSIKAVIASLMKDSIIDLPDFGASLHFHLYVDETVGYNIKVYYTSTSFLSNFSLC